MSKLPSISVITPTLNQAGFIRETLDSVLGQDYPNLEYLVIDGGSSDGTKDILDSYGERIRWMELGEEGQSSAINTGWRETSGEILAWINSDDTYAPGALMAVGEYLQQNADTDMVYGDCDHTDTEGEYLRSYPTQTFDYLRFVRNTENFIPQPAAFIRRSVLERVGYLNEKLEYVMDFEFWLRIGMNHKIEYVPLKLASLRLHPDAKSIAGLGKLAGELVDVYEAYFKSPSLPPEVLVSKTEAMGNIYYRAADCAYWGNDYASARRYAQISRDYLPEITRGLWSWIAMGRLGKSIVNLFIKNPYST